MNHTFKEESRSKKSTISVKLEHAFENTLTAEHTAQPMASIC